MNNSGLPRVGHFYNFVTPICGLGSRGNYALICPDADPGKIAYKRLKDLSRPAYMTPIEDAELFTYVRPATELELKTAEVVLPPEDVAAKVRANEAFLDLMRTLPTPPGVDHDSFWNGVSVGWMKVIAALGLDGR